MRRSALRLPLGLLVTFAVNCGSVTGGGSGTGGATGTGTGGATGSGGTGSGGTTGTGGHAAGGQGGSGEACAQLASDYLAALPAARACTPGAANQCQTLEPITLGNCANCKFYVNDATALMPIVDQWTQQGCGSTGPVCAIACISPGNPGDCVATDSAAPGGVCGSSVATPN